MAKLATIPVFPPRRTVLDLLPNKLLDWLRDKYRWPNYTAREVWCVHSWLLRVMADKLLIAASQPPKLFTHVADMEHYEPGKKGWN